MAFFGVFKDGDLENDNRFMVAHIALHEKYFLGKKSYSNQKLYFYNVGVTMAFSSIGQHIGIIK